MAIVSRRNMLKGAAGAAALATVSKASTTFAAPAVIQSGPIEITYWSAWSAELGDADKALTDAFNASQTDIKVNFQFQGSYEETAQKLTAAIGAGNTPDLCALSDVWWFKFYLAGALQPVDEFFASQGVDATDYVDTLLNDYNPGNGLHYALPFARSTPLFYYNKTMFEAAGITAAPATWDEFAGYAPELVDSANSVTAFSLGASDGSYSAWTFQPSAWQWGGEYSKPDLTITINSPEVAAAATYFQDAVKAGWAYSTGDPNADFAAGLSGAMLASTGGLAGLTSTITDFEFGTAFLPEGPAGFGCCTGGAGLGILKASAPEKQEAAFAYAAYKTTPENTATWSQSTGYMPVRKSAVDNMADFFAANPNFKVAVDQLAKTRSQDSARVQIPNGDQIIGAALGQIIVGLEEVQSVLDDLAATLTEEAAPVIEALQALATPTA